MLNMVQKILRSINLMNNWTVYVGTCLIPDIQGVPAFSAKLCQYIL